MITDPYFNFNQEEIDMINPNLDDEEIPDLIQEDEEMINPNSNPCSDLVVFGPQPMEVSEEEFRKSPTTFTWTIENFSKVNNQLYSEVFVAGGYQWRLLVFPKGNKQMSYMSIYLDVAQGKERRYTKYKLSVIDQVYGKHTVSHDTERLFSGQEDSGFQRFMPISVLRDAEKGYLVDDTCVIEAEVTVTEVVDYWSYDSKKETGYVGLKNQGATCYMNSLLQTMYHIPYFRKAVYHMPIADNGGMPLALLRLFYRLQYGDDSVGTKELTKSFGWDTYDSFQQHDIQELNRVLCERLEDKMKGTVVEGRIQELFEGHHMNYIECIDVDYKSTRKESFYDIQLDVRGCCDVYASFDKYVEVERMEGENKYHAEQHGLQDAKKGVSFVDFPPVLQLQLKRFEYDFTRDMMMKINDSYKFPVTLDLDRENGKYLSPDSDRSVRNLYTLHSVLVHRGGVSGGHYYAFIRPTLSDQWFKFDDDRVTKEDEKTAVDEQFGGEDSFNITRHSSAYMLVYIRESDKNKIMCDVDEMDIDESLLMRWKREQEERELREKERAEAHLYTTIKVARDEDLFVQIGRDIHFDLVRYEQVRSFRIKKQTPFKDFQEEVAREFAVPVEFQRFWLWEKSWRLNTHTCRHLTPSEEQQSIGDLKVQNLFMEVEVGPDSHPIALPEKAEEDILLFCKLYDPKKEQLQYIGRLFVNSSDSPSEVLSKLNEMAGFSSDEDIDLYKEVRPVDGRCHCKSIDKEGTFFNSKLKDGDIIWYQRSTTSEIGEELRTPDVPSFLEYLRNCLVVRFRSLKKPDVDEFSLELSLTFTYDEVVGNIAGYLGLDDRTKIRLTPRCGFQNEMPSHSPIKFRGVKDLSDMLAGYFRETNDILYYEVLDIPLPELENMRTLSIAFNPYFKQDEGDEKFSVRVPKTGSVGDVLDALKTKVELSDPNAELRLLEIFGHRICKVFLSSDKIKTINDRCSDLRADVISEEEKDLGPEDELIHVIHYFKDEERFGVLGVPFVFGIRKEDTLMNVKEGIQKKLQVKDEELANWRFIVRLDCYSDPRYLQDSDVVLKCLSELRPSWIRTGFGYIGMDQRHLGGFGYFGMDQRHLGIHHSHKSVAKPVYQKNRYTCDKSVKICS